MNNQKPEWEKEFDEKFCFHDTKYDCFVDEDQKPSEIKSFITQLLDAEKKRIVEGLMEMMKNTKTEFDVGSEMSTPRIIRDNGYNSALDQAIDLINI